MEEKEYYWGLDIPFVGVVKAFRFRTSTPIEKLKVMHLEPDKYREYLEKGVLDITLSTKWDYWKMRTLKILGMLNPRKITILIPEDYL